MPDEKVKSEFLFNRKEQLFLNFIDHTDQARNAIQHMNNFISNMLDTTQKGQAIEYLDIGCGYGYKTQGIINKIKERCAVNTTAIDPSSELLSIFRDRTTDTNIKFICSSWEDYQAPISEKFHLITSIHTFYYIDNWKEAIKRMQEHLNEQGAICISIRSNDQVCQFKNHIFKKIHANNKTERDFDELCNTLDMANIKYKTDIVESKLNIQDCLEPNEKGKQLIEFLLRVPYESLDTSVRREISNYLKKNHDNDCLTHQDGFVWITH